MINPTAIMPAIKKIAGKPLGMTSKVLGAAATASVLYDAHINGCENSVVYDQISTGRKCLNQFRQYKISDKKSATIAGLKKAWYDIQWNHPFHPYFKSKGYLSEFGKTIVNNAPLLALSAVALKFKNAGKIAGCLIAAKGITTLCHDVLGIGQEKNK